ncbi:MAG: DUF1674 domain-containing protein [Proteobacteria bacterium]|nr:DUF1674 domain-containing protein [Pseudomonadota bacterium]
MRVKSDSPDSVGVDASLKSSSAGSPNRSTKLSGKNHADAGQSLTPPEIGGAAGPEPTRYGDWEHKGRCTDF